MSDGSDDVSTHCRFSRFGSFGLERTASPKLRLLLQCNVLRIRKPSATQSKDQEQGGGGCTFMRRIAALCFSGFML